MVLVALAALVAMMTHSADYVEHPPAIRDK
jgi:hypothetical protein